VSKYQKQFISMGGKVFWADVYRVLRAFGVTCPAVQHAVKKLLMPGQRGAKNELQDLTEALLSVSEAIAMARAELPEGDTLTGETEPEPQPKPEPEPEPKLVTWRLCNTHGFWFPSNKIPKGWVALEAHTQPVETVKQLPEGQEP